MIISPVNPISKLNDVGTTIFSIIGQLANEFNAINLSQGSPDFPCSVDLRRQVELAMQANHNQYAPMTGLPGLKEQISLKIKNLHGQNYDSDEEILITGSASQALYSVISALVKPGDEVIYFEPCFDSYAPIVRLQGAKPVGIKLTVPEFQIDWNLVKSVLNTKTKMIILNSPHNPSGSVMSQSDLDILAELTRETDIIVLSDEVYEHVIFDGQQHLSMSGHKELAARSVVVTSFGKTFHVTGWRVGCCVGPAVIMKEVVKVHQFMMFSADTPMQYAFCEHMKNPVHYLGLSDFYQSKRDLMTQELKSGPFDILPSHGSFFMLINYGHLTQKSDSEVVKELICKQGVATIPLSAFYSDGTDNKLLRLSFSKNEQTIIDGVRALNNFR
ncbi:methionine aminotransferase [Psychromonas sp.]|uniref:methionine aminotransferase n=1 Tax=Psychromonas sp. TaxID=1884585 RepID=UPI003A9708C2